MQASLIDAVVLDLCTLCGKEAWLNRLVRRLNRLVCRLRNPTGDLNRWRPGRTWLVRRLTPPGRSPAKLSRLVRRLSRLVRRLNRLVRRLNRLVRRLNRLVRRLRNPTGDLNRWRPGRTYLARSPAKPARLPAKPARLPAKPARLPAKKPDRDLAETWQGPGRGRGLREVT